MDCSLPGSSVHGTFQARVLEWGAIAFSDTLTVHVLKQAKQNKLSSWLHLSLYLWPHFSAHLLSKTSKLLSEILFWGHSSQASASITLPRLFFVKVTLTLLYKWQFFFLPLLNLSAAINTINLPPEMLSFLKKNWSMIDIFIFNLFLLKWSQCKIT